LEAFLAKSQKPGFSWFRAKPFSRFLNAVFAKAQTAFSPVATFGAITIPGPLTQKSISIINCQYNFEVFQFCD
jgi:hypothetical protein